MSTKENHAYLERLRHSAAHLLAQAVLELYPNTKLTIGPATTYGFFYDFVPEENFKEEDLPRIEKKMREIAKRDYTITGGQVPKEEARKLYPDNKFKLELIDGIEGDTVGIYHQGDFYDLCRGGHVESLGEIKHFKLTGISGAYWRADREGDKLQRISGVAFATKEDLEKHLQHIEDAKLYDHRRLGRQLDLFSFHDEAPGMPFFHDKGFRIYNQLIEYARGLQDDAEYKEIKTPLVLNEQLWKISGHYDNYKENMYFTEIDDETFCVRPMNCPGSILIYNERPHSYRELPLRVAEFGTVHRYELSGVLHGLFRARVFTIDDAHIYCREDQIEQEIVGVLQLAQTIYDRFNFKEIVYALSTRPEKSMGAGELWGKAESALESALKSQKLPYEVYEGDGAFYGPKISIYVKDSMDREWQCGTVQLDFFQPQNFNLEYVASDQSRQRPVIIHRALYGSIERFMGILLEHYKGRLPVWIAPVQVRILTITDAQHEYAVQVKDALSAAGIRVECDESGDQIGAQIRRAQQDKLPLMLVIGKKEQEKNTVTLRYPDGKQEFGKTVEEVIAHIKQG